MSVRSPVFEIILERRRRRWVLSVRTTEGMAVITGSRSSRSAARYEAHRALFSDAAERALPFAALAAKDPGQPKGSRVALGSARFAWRPRNWASLALRSGPARNSRRISGYGPNSSYGAGSRASGFLTAKASCAISSISFRTPTTSRRLQCSPAPSTGRRSACHCSKKAIMPHSSVQRTGARCTGVLSEKPGHRANNFVEV